MNDAQNQRIILQELAQTAEFLMPESSLHTFVNLRLPQPLTGTELSAALRSLESKLQVISVRHEDQLKWKITANGKARLAE